MNYSKSYKRSRRFRIKKRPLDVGDMVEMPRILGLYSHWGVYLSGKKIAHVTGRDDANRTNSCNLKAKACVKIEDFCKVVKKAGYVRRNNKLDRHLRVLSKSEIEQRAKDMAGPIDYSLLSNNCEHIAVYLRYGVRRSMQIEKILGVVFALCASVVGKLMIDYGDTTIAFVGVVLVVAVVLAVMGFIRKEFASSC